MAVTLNAGFIKRFPGGPAIRAEALMLHAGVTVLFGASGSGKTTILRCLAGLEMPDEGMISFGDEIWFERAAGSRRAARCVSPQQRNIGFVAQDGGLFPHLSVGANIGYGLQGLSAAEKTARVVHTLKWLGLEGLEQRLPRELSGGQQQRVALGRAIVRQPRLLLLDEPMAALDAPARRDLRGELRRWLDELQIPTLLVTHDRTEALALGNSIVVMNQGRIEQAGPVRDVFNRPASLAVAQLTGMEMVVEGRIVSRGETTATVEACGLRLVGMAADISADEDRVLVCIRGEDVVLTRTSDVRSSARNCIRATVDSMQPESPLIRVNLACGFPLSALVTREAIEALELKTGTEVFALIKAPHVHLIPQGRGM